MMWRRGKKHGNISGLIRIKNIQQFNFLYSYDKGVVTQRMVMTDGNKAPFLLGTNHENYKAYNRLNEFSSFVLVRMSTRIHDFQIHRQVETEFITGAGEEAESHWTEDKITFTDPKIYFYREQYGRGMPGALSPTAPDHAFKEISKHKCITGCKDGWWWSTSWPTKGEREMVDTTVLHNMMDGSQSIAAYSKNKLLQELGAKSKQEDGQFDDQHDCKFWIGRDAPYPASWYTGKSSAVPASCERYCRDHVGFIMTTYITVRAFRKRL